MESRIKKVKDYLRDVEGINSILTLPEERNDISILVRLESQFACKKIQELLEECAVSEADAATQIRKFLRNRWDVIYGNDENEIKGSDAIYFHHPDTKANRACLILAKKIESTSNTYSYELLMPTVQAVHCYYPYRGQIECYKFNEMILSDNGVPIKVAECLDTAADKKTTMLFHTCEGSSNKELNSREKKRIIDHSEKAHRYYKAIKLYVKTGEKGPIESAKKEFHDAIKKDNDRVTASYGGAGKKQLAKYILTLANVKNWAELQDFRLRHVYSPHEWYELFSHINSEDLFKIVLGIDNKELKIQNSDHAIYKSEFLTKAKEAIKKKLEDHNEYAYVYALKFCQVALYYQERKAKADGFFKPLFGAYLEAEKLYAARALQYSLTQGTRRNQLEEYVGDYFKMRKLSSKGLEEKRIIGALHDGELGKLANEVLQQIHSEQNPDPKSIKP